jgi:zinc finger protein 830
MKAESNRKKRRRKVMKTDTQKRARLEREEREEILARFEEEQRVQDEADERVNALKIRLERLKQARLNKKR